MKLESFSISNFKAFGASPQSVPLKPLTLVFGPNSAGKSSLFQGLRWALNSAKMRDFESRTSDSIDFGSFRSILHQQDKGRQIEIKFSFSNGDGTLPVGIVHRLGFMSDEDLTCFRNKLDSEWDVVADHEKITKSFNLAKGMIDLFFDYQEPDTEEEIMSIILDEEVCLKQIEASILRNIELGWNELYGYEHLGGRRPIPDDLVKAYQQAQEDRRSLDEIMKKHGERLEIHWEKVNHAIWQEMRLCSVQAIEIYYGNNLVLRAKRSLGENALQIQVLDENQTESMPFPPDSWTTSLSHAVTGTVFAESLFSPDKVKLIKQGDFSLISNQAIEKAGAWLIFTREQVVETERNQIHLGPLRHLPERRSLIGIPGEAPADHRLKSWVHLRDQPILQKQVNLLLERLNCRKYRFQTKLFSTGRSFQAALDHMEPTFDRYIDENDAYEELDEMLTSLTSAEVWADLTLFDIDNQVTVSMRDVGVGISQMTPILIHACAGRKKLITIEQPELHLHPALQAELGDVFIESALGENKNTFLLETHSEHLILRILRRIRETTRGKLPDGHIPITPDDVAVLYVEPSEEGSVIRELRVNDQGRFIDDWPNGFFEDRLEELL